MICPQLPWFQPGVSSPYIGLFSQIYALEISFSISWILHNADFTTLSWSLTAFYGCLCCSISNRSMTPLQHNHTVCHPRCHDRRRLAILLTLCRHNLNLLVSFDRQQRTTSHPCLLRPSGNVLLGYLGRSL
jgi:hypothetical protein